MLKAFFAISVCVLSCLSLKGADSDDLNRMFTARSKSVVCVRFMLEREENRGQIWTWGSVANEDGLILVPYNEIMPERISSLKDFKVFWNGGDIEGAPAEYLGCDKRCMAHYIRLKKMSPDLTPLSRFQRGDKPKAADNVWGVGIYEESVEWMPCFYRSYVNAVIEKPLFESYCPTAISQIGGTVFDFKGNFIGWGLNESNCFYLLSTQDNKRQPIRLVNPSLTDSFLSSEEFDRLVKCVPSNPEGDDVAWLGVAGMQTLKRDVAKLMGLENKSAIVISDVIENSPAKKAGLVKGDIIVSFGGKNLERFVSDSRLIADMRFKLLDRKIGDKITLGIISAGAFEPRNVEIVLGKSPKNYRKSSFEYFKKLGFSVREFLLDDSIERRIMKPDIDAAVVQFVKPNSPASSALPTPLSQGDMIKEINSKPVNGYSETVETLSKIASQKDIKDIVLLVEDFNETKVVRIKLD